MLSLMFSFQILGGTPIYSPPDTRVTFLWDVWCCGVVLYLMLFANFPFSLADIEMRKYIFVVPRGRQISERMASIAC